VQIATKFGLVSHAGGGPGVTDSSAANLKAAVEGSLKRLGVDHIDLYYQHRVDRNTPIEETAGAVAELIRQGKVCSSACRGVAGDHPPGPRRTAGVGPADSLWTRRGGRPRHRRRGQGHWRRDRRYPAQTALAWILTRGDDIAPIPGTRRVSRVDSLEPAVNHTMYAPGPDVRENEPTRTLLKVGGTTRGRWTRSPAG
jgi:aryl-alcohol dehydrogenase-like predicted oxidoreductase